MQIDVSDVPWTDLARKPDITAKCVPIELSRSEYLLDRRFQLGEHSDRCGVGDLALHDGFLGLNSLAVSTCHHPDDRIEIAVFEFEAQVPEKLPHLRLLHRPPPHSAKIR